MTTDETELLIWRH